METVNQEGIAPFHLERFLGTWFEIARMPRFFERGIQQVTAEYSLNEDGSVQVVNRGIRNGKHTRITGKARFRGERTRGDFQLSFFPPFSSRYRILYADPEYTVMLTAGSSLRSFWILTRDPVPAPETVADLLTRASEIGVDLTQLEFPG